MNNSLKIILIILIFYLIFKYKNENFSTDPLTKCKTESTMKDTIIKNLANSVTNQYLPVRTFFDENKVEFCNSYPEFKTIIKSLGMKCPEKK